MIHNEIWIWEYYKIIFQKIWTIFLDEFGYSKFIFFKTEAPLITNRIQANLNGWPSYSIENINLFRVTQRKKINP